MQILSQWRACAILPELNTERNRDERQGPVNYPGLIWTKQGSYFGLIVRTWRLGMGIGMIGIDVEYAEMFNFKSWVDRGSCCRRCGCCCSLSDSSMSLSMSMRMSLLLSAVAAAPLLLPSQLSELSVGCRAKFRRTRKCGEWWETRKSEPNLRFQSRD